MGMSAADAKAFYAMTNSVPFESARWLDSREMRGWVPTQEQKPAAAAPQTAPRLAFLTLDLDLASAVN
jgi:hypothetical protein